MTQIVFAYKSAAVKVDCEGPVTQRPPQAVRNFFAGVDASPLMPDDRTYLSLFYDQLGKMTREDWFRKKPVFRTLGHFASLHGRSLAASPVFANNRLLASIDEGLVRLMGAASGNQMNHVLAISACQALAWRFAIHADD